MKAGTLVKSKKYAAIGIVVEVFADLDPDNPWVRVLFTSEPQRHQWCRVADLKILKKSETGVNAP